MKKQILFLVLIYQTACFLQPSFSVFVFPSDRYHLKDVIVGKIYFLLVRIKIKHMEIDIIKRETTGTGPSVYHENDTIAKYEIMDGAPVRGKQHFFTISVTLMEHLLIQSESICNLSQCISYFRRVHSHSVIPGWLWSDPNNAGHKQEVLSPLLPEPGADWRGREALLQTTGDERW